MILKHQVGEAELARLPDPELFRDAQHLAARGVWTASELDGADALLVALVRKLSAQAQRD